MIRVHLDFRCRADMYDLAILLDVPPARRRFFSSHRWHLDMSRVGDTRHLDSFFVAKPTKRQVRRQMKLAKECWKHV